MWAGRGLLCSVSGFLLPCNFQLMAVRTRVNLACTIIKQDF